jgi:hypothetical protein
MRKLLFIVLGCLIFQSCSQTAKDNENLGEIVSEQNDSPESKYDFVIENSCGFDRPLKNTKVYSFESDKEAENALNRIMKLTGLPANFEIRAASIDNACAVIKCDDNGDCQRFILYNQEFMEKIKSETSSNFAELAILAHEIAHHLSGHTLTSAGSSYDMELEADKFAGFILYKLGATIDDAKKAYSKLNENGSSTHPPKSARIAAISNGYYEAKRNGETIEPVKSISNTGIGNSPQRSNNTPKANTTVNNSKKKDHGSWLINHRICSANGQFLVKEGQQTAFCIGCMQEYHLRWSGGIDVMTGKPAVLDYMETENSRSIRMLQKQGW